MNYYNEHNKHAAQWLRNLIAGGMIPPGHVDDRSIEDVHPNDLRGYIQCHFFAGIGGWSEALRLAGWPADRPVWTGSCPCQSFSTAGKRKGTSDPRHLWPVWYELIKASKPPVIFGEQVEAAIGHGWLDIVSNDMEREGYEVGAAVLPACSVGAPHIRKRLWFMAYRNCDTSGGNTRGISGEEIKSIRGQLQDSDRFGDGGKENNMADRINERSQRGISRRTDEKWKVEYRHAGCDSATNHWSSADWIWCQDEKYRPIEPGTLPLADGVSKRVVKIRGYGNAIVPQVGAEVIKTAMEYLER